jgi:hypothetical protein
MPVVEAASAELHLSAGIRACMAAASTDASKQMLQGIHLGSGHMEATDGHRLMRYALDLPDALDVVLPASTMRLLQDRVCTIAVAKGQAVIDAGDGITIYSRIMDGAYPDVAKLIPDTFEHTITIDRRRLTRALERVALIAEAHNSVVKLEAVGGTIAITAEADANNGKELLKVDGTAKGMGVQRPLPARRHQGFQARRSHYPARQFGNHTRGTDTCRRGWCNLSGNACANTWLKRAPRMRFRTASMWFMNSSCVLTATTRSFNTVPSCGASVSAKCAITWPKHAS